ncbi:hypothetical protein QJS10_CPB17g00843 [Acorus calamus]|uniref:Uncharacterized protein n=1 Tax=Acorus calamus TaxID=4465 RepID=A0AAV9CXM8_ACOCL|nr:hypothetical protein QJS10_CPB17g00843 [Acorus calamus]
MTTTTEAIDLTRRRQQHRLDPGETGERALTLWSRRIHRPLLLPPSLSPSPVLLLGEGGVGAIGAAEDRAEGAVGTAGAGAALTLSHVGKVSAAKSSGNGGGRLPLDKGKEILRGDSSRADVRAAPIGTVSTKGNKKGEWIPVRQPSHKSIISMTEAPTTIEQNNAFTLLSEVQDEEETTIKVVQDEPFLEKAGHQLIQSMENPSKQRQRAKIVNQILTATIEATQQEVLPDTQISETTVRANQSEELCTGTIGKVELIAQTVGSLTYVEGGQQQLLEPSTVRKQSVTSTLLHQVTEGTEDFFIDLFDTPPLGQSTAHSNYKHAKAEGEGSVTKDTNGKTKCAGSLVLDPKIKTRVKKHKKPVSVTHKRKPSKGSSSK